MPSPTHLTALLVAAALAAPATGSPADDAGGRIRGITISTHGSGRDWGDDAMVPTMARIRSVGANWVTVHPYARVSPDGSVDFRELDPARPPAWLVRPIREAHAAGMKIMIKPHLAYWGSGFGWRGEIGFDDEAAWERFFSSYRRWIVTIAAATRDADGFAVGTELDRTVGHEADWRRIVAAVRAATPAPLTYAANWTDYERVPFWDALDVVGIQAYFPLVGEDERADDDALRAGWRRWLGRLHEFSGRVDRPIVFTELGYTDSNEAPVRPWESRSDGEAGRRMQARCLRIALEELEREPAVIGAFLWKWFPEPRPVGRDFRLADPEIRAVIEAAWCERC